MEVIIRLTCEEKPTVQDVLDYINDLGEELDFEIVDTRQQAEERLLKLSSEINEEVTKVLNHSYQSYISQFKDGVSDALLLGKRADVNLTSAYKQGYDFGMTMYCKMEGLDDDNA